MRVAALRSASMQARPTSPVTRGPQEATAKNDNPKKMLRMTCPNVFLPACLELYGDSLSQQ